MNEDYFYRNIIQGTKIYYFNVNTYDEYDDFTIGSGVFSCI